MSSAAVAPRLAGIACPHCDRRLDHARIEPGALLCPYCRRTFHAVRFDPLPLDASVPRLTDLGGEGANPCATHPGNAALVACSRCGAFLCALCHVDVDGRVLCPPCFDRMKGDGELPSVVAGYRDYARMALFIALLGLVPFLGLIAGPGGLYYAWRARKERPKVPGRGGSALAWTAFALGVLSTVWGIACVVAVVRVS